MAWPSSGFGAAGFGARGFLAGAFFAGGFLAAGFFAPFLGTTLAGAAGFAAAFSLEAYRFLLGDLVYAEIFAISFA